MNADYERVARAIGYIRNHVAEQPDLKTVAGHVGLSPWHFQRLFQRWAGVSPKRFLEFLTVEQAKRLLEQSTSVLDASMETGLSGPGRLHDHFVSIEAATPGEYKKKGAGLEIAYGFHESPFGTTFIAQTDRGIVGLAFVDDVPGEVVLEGLRQTWPRASMQAGTRATARTIRQIFSTEKEEISLLVKGTNFQIKVWQALLSIPMGAVTSYQYIAESIGRPNSVRAVANAIGANPVAWLIPCHRVLRNNGELSGYRWGPERKRLMLAREWAVRSSKDSLLQAGDD